MVGHHTSFGLLMGTKIFDESTTFVNFKTAVDAIPTLLDGSLDVYIDSGGLTPYIESGILKSLGNLHNAINTPGVNLNKKYPGAALYKTMAAITTSKNNDPKDIEELNQRLRLILTDEKFVNMIKQVSNTPVFKSVKESNEVVEFMKKDIASKK
jgi:tripartite-type tricarboxylate transporter receptor subunit TctC